MAWQEIPIKNKIFQNVAESALGTLNAFIENCYVTYTGGIARFPRLNKKVELVGDAPTFLEEWRGDLVATSGGLIYRIDPSSYVATDVTGVAVSGPGRTVFAKTEDELLMAAGRSIVSLAGSRTTLLSEEAPESTHVGFVSGYVIAIEPRSGRFKISQPGQYTVWDDLDVFSAEGNTDNINALLVSDFGELLLAGPDSIEQFDAAPSGVRPFFKRWGLGTGLYAPYTILSVDNRIWGLSERLEWVAFSSQIGTPASDDIQNALEAIDNFDDAWAVELPIKGQRFMIIQCPYATNRYGTEGITLLYDYKKRRWGNLFGWDVARSLPTKWEGWSYKQVGSKKFVGGNGCVYELDEFSGSTPQKMLWRSGHISRPGNQPFRINSSSMRIERGASAVGATVPQLSVRVNKNNMGFGKWVRGSLGRAGDRHMTLNFPAMGDCDSVQFEIQVTDDGPIEIASFGMDVTNLKR